MPIGAIEASRPAVPNEVAPGCTWGHLVVFTGAGMTDPHHVLGVPAGASQEEITSAYHRLVRQHHPDATGEPTEPDRFRAVVAAYAALRSRNQTEPTPPEPTPTEPTPTEPTRPERARTRLTTPAIRVGPVRYHGPPRTR